MTSEFCIAVHALVFLHHKSAHLSSEALAKNICTNPARIRKVMAKLKKAGLVTTKEGADGGYFFNCDPRAVVLSDVCDALGVTFVSSAWRSGGTDRECLIASGMAEVMDGLYQELNQVCMERLRKITLADIDAKLFAQGQDKEG